MELIATIDAGGDTGSHDFAVPHEAPPSKSELPHVRDFL
jgi:hypothetical protein